MEAIAGSPGRDSRGQAARRLEEYSAAQHGYVTRAQANQAGVGDTMLHRLLAGGWVDRAEHGVYRMRGTPDRSWAPVWVVWLSLDPARDAVERARHPKEVVAGPTAASAVYGIGDLRPEPYQFWVPRRRFLRRAEVRLRVGRLPREDIRVVDGLPATTPMRTIADLVVDGYDLGHVTDSLRDAVRTRLIDDRDLPAQLADMLRRTLPARRLPAAEPLAVQITGTALR